MLYLAAARIGETHGPGSESVGAGTASYLWLLLPFLPLIAALLQPLLVGRARKARPGTAEGIWATAVCGSVAVGFAALWLGGASQGDVTLGGMVGWGLRFSISPMGLLFSMFATGLWALAAFFSVSYLAGGHGHRRYYFYFLLSLSGTVGVFLAGDLFTLFVFFELVSLGSYPLVVHEETDEAMSAGRLYLFMGIAGGLVLLLGTMWLQSLNGGEVPVGLPIEVAGSVWPWAVSMVLLVLGFGVKAGMYPVHVWLPRAHPVAPSPASALLSGVMIKTGAYGIYQVVRMFSTGGGAGQHASSPALGLLASAGHESALASPAPPIVAAPYVTAPLAAEALPNLGQALGMGLVIVALMTLFLGAFLALVQVNAKRVLAYSSVSQMGYILLGAGMAGVLGADEAMGAAGFALHVLNHALFKSTMFMLIGVVYLKTHELDIRRLGGLASRLPLTALVFGMAVMAIAGVPGLNGYTSKTLLHDAILVLDHSHPGPLWKAVEWLFTAGGALTFAYTAKLWYFVFWRRPAEAGRRPAGEGGPDTEAAGGGPRPGIPGETAADRVLAVALGAPMLVIGLFPARVVSGLVAPFALASGFSHVALHHVEGVHFFAWEALRGAFLSLGLGLVVLAVLYFLGFPHPEIRRGPSVERSVFEPLIRLGAGAVRRIARLDVAVDSAFIGVVEGGARLVEAFTVLDRGIDRGMEQTAERSARLIRGAQQADLAVDRGFDLMARGAARTVSTITSLDRGMDKTWQEAAAQSARAVRAATATDQAVDRAYTRAAELGKEAVEALGGERRAMAPSRGAAAAGRGRTVPDQAEKRLSSRQLWTLMNLNVATLMMAGLIGLMLLIFLLWR